MRLIAFSLLIAISSIAPAAAQEHGSVIPEVSVSKEAKPESDRNADNPPPLMLGVKPAANGAAAGSVSGPAAGSEKCSNGSSGGINCLNQRLQDQVDRVNPSVNQPPVDAKSSDTKVGVVNIPGVQQQYGKNFGVSAVPYRPAPPTFTSPAVAPNRPALPVVVPNRAAMPLFTPPVPRR